MSTNMPGIGSVMSEIGFELIEFWGYVVTFIQVHQVPLDLMSWDSLTSSHKMSTWLNFLTITGLLIMRNALNKYKHAWYWFSHSWDILTNSQKISSFCCIWYFQCQCAKVLKQNLSEQLNHRIGWLLRAHTIHSVSRTTTVTVCDVNTGRQRNHALLAHITLWTCVFAHRIQ